MTRFEIVFKRSASKDLRRLPSEDIRRILARIDKLAGNPRPMDSTILSGQERYRVRQGVYRILYEVHDEELVIAMVRIARRSHVYRQS